MIPLPLPPRPRHRRGYALMAALLLVIVASLASTVAISRAQLDAQRERERQLLWVGQQFRTALQRYYSVRVAGVQQYPEKLADLLLDGRFPQPVRHLRAIYRDPFTDKAEWKLVRHQGRIVGVRSASERAPLKQAGFSNADNGFEMARHHSDWIFAAVPLSIGALDADGNAKVMPVAVAAAPGKPRPGEGGKPQLPGPEPVDPQQEKVDKCHADALPQQAACERVRKEEFDACTLAWRRTFEICLSEAAKP